jgi:hypothetical protein
MPNPAVFAEPLAELSWRPIDSTQVISLPQERLWLSTIEPADVPLPAPPTAARRA